MSLPVVLTSILFITITNPSSGGKADNINDITVKDMNGKLINLSYYNGKVLMIVNVASECGFTPQYKEFEAIYE